jgi:fatty acid desaturase
MAAEPARRGWIFDHSALDGLLVLLGSAHVAAIIGGSAGFTYLPWWALVALGAVVVALYPVNVNCVSHNFIHNEFFRLGPLNTAFSLWNSIALGLPQTLYHWHHLNHHRWNNDAKGADGTTRDLSSIFRHGRGDAPEGALAYSLLSFFRVDFPELTRAALKHRRGRQLAFEAVAVLVLFGVLAWADPVGFAAFYLPTWYLGWSLASFENYYEHWGANPADKYASSVSSYGRLYNLLSFNNGYHQEHHWRPQTHWTRMPEVHAEWGATFREHGARVIRGPHLTAFLEPPRAPGAT